jgi:hypothetical protein
MANNSYLNNLKHFISLLSSNFNIDLTDFDFNRDSVSDKYLVYNDKIRLECSVIISSPNIPYIPQFLTSLIDMLPRIILFKASNNYSNFTVMFLYKEYLKKSNNIQHVMETRITTDLSGNILHCIKTYGILYDTAPDKYTTILDINFTGLPQDDVLDILHIHLNIKDSIIEILPELFLVGPSNIPNLKDRIDLAKMLII